MRCLADFVLDSDLSLKADAPPLTLNGPNGSFVLTLANVVPDPALPAAVLSAQLIFDADAIEECREIALDKLRVALNVLSFVTNRKFSLVVLRRVIDWTPGLVDRQAITYAEEPEWSLAEPVLDEGFVNTVERLLVRVSGEQQQLAMRWYRLGILTEGIDAQFTYFWFALEIAAEVLKGSEKVPSRCPRCQSELYCAKCDDHPLHRRYPGEAIRQIIETVHPDNSAEVFETLQLIRHTLMHGGQIRSVADKLPCSDEQALTKLANVTWYAINHMFDKADSQTETPLVFGYVDNVTRRKIVAGGHIKTKLPGDPNSPRLEDFPRIDANLKPAPRDVRD